MKHGYVVMDWDIPLFICETQEEADRLVLAEIERATPRRRDWIHHVMVPYAPSTRPHGAASPAGDKRA